MPNLAAVGEEECELLSLASVPFVLAPCLILDRERQLGGLRFPIRKADTRVRRHRLVSYLQ